MTGGRGGISTALALLASESRTHPSSLLWCTVLLMADVWCKMHVVMQHDESIFYMKAYLLELFASRAF